MFRKLREKINLGIAKSPRKAVLVGIMLFNVTFIMIAAAIIAAMSKHITGMTDCSFWEAVYYTTTMILDAGCIESIIQDVGAAGWLAAVICIIVIILGMVFFTGAVIGYITNIISDFIDNKNNGKNKLIISDHIVIINWNSRGAEIINDYLLKGKNIKVVVFVPDNKDEVDEEIRNRLDTTLMNNKGLKEKLLYIVREGDVAAARDLDDICISKAKTVIILDSGNGKKGFGNNQTVKTLIQVSEQSKANSEQTILVEVSDDWTKDLVQRIIDFDSDWNQESIVPVLYKTIFGKFYATIALMPEFLDVIEGIISGGKTNVVSRKIEGDSIEDNEDDFILKHLSNNCHSLPLTFIEGKRGKSAFYITDNPSEIDVRCGEIQIESGIKINDNCGLPKRCVIILGHNSNIDALMEGLHLYGSDIKILMVDDQESLESHNYYKEYPNVETAVADIYDEEAIKERMNRLSNVGLMDISILILSDDSVENEDIDANALTYLIYLQDQIRLWTKYVPIFERSMVNIIVEILNPKNEDIVRSYGADRVIISNRYISRIIAQASVGEAIHEFFSNYDNKQYLIKEAGEYFQELPGKCTACELIRRIFASGADDNKAILIGYIRNNKECIMFKGDQRKHEVELQPDDKLILFGNH